MDWFERIVKKKKVKQSNIDIDLDGQPANPQINAKRRIDRGIHEMLGLIKGILIDGRVDECEVRSLNAWLELNKELVTVWPASTIKQRIDRVLKDGLVDDEEREDLRDLFNNTLGSDLPFEKRSTSLPLDTKVDCIQFQENIFVLTGKFYHGPRKYCETEIVSRGGSCESRITKKTNYLVIGTAGSRDWIQSAWGRKIEQAVAYKEAGVPILIVGEERWVNAL